MFRIILGVLLLFTTTHAGFEVPDDMKEVIASLKNACVAETGVTEELLVRARGGDFAEEQSLKCYMKCLLEMAGCMTDDGKLDVDATLAIFPPNFVAAMGPVVKKCGTVMGVDVCDNIFQTNKCQYQGNPDMYFLP